MRMVNSHYLSSNARARARIITHAKTLVVPTLIAHVVDDVVVQIIDLIIPMRLYIVGNQSLRPNVNSPQVGRRPSSLLTLPY